MNLYKLSWIPFIAFSLAACEQRPSDSEIEATMQLVGQKQLSCLFQNKGDMNKCRNIPEVIEGCKLLQKYNQAYYKQACSDPYNP